MAHAEPQPRTRLHVHTVTALPMQSPAPKKRGRLTHCRMQQLRHKSYPCRHAPLRTLCSIALRVATYRRAARPSRTRLRPRRGSSRQLDTTSASEETHCERILSLIYRTIHEAQSPRETKVKTHRARTSRLKQATHEIREPPRAAEHM